jgi:hypothetical protein
VRTLLFLALAGIAVGVALAFLIGGTRPAPRAATCTREGLALAPTLAIPPTGGTIQVGLAAPGTGCVVGARAARTVRFRVEDRAGHVLVDSVQKGGPAPGARIATRMTGGISVAAAPLCRARQPLRVDVWVAGAHATGYSRMQFSGRRCTVAS